jgi:hypothetical protein
MEERITESKQLRNSDIAERSAHQVTTVRSEMRLGSTSVP